MLSFSGTNCFIKTLNKNRLCRFANWTYWEVFRINIFCKPNIISTARRRKQTWPHWLANQSAAWNFQERSKCSKGQFRVTAKMELSLQEKCASGRLKSRFSRRTVVVEFQIVCVLKAGEVIDTIHVLFGPLFAFLGWKTAVMCWKTWSESVTDFWAFQGQASNSVFHRLWRHWITCNVEYYYWFEKYNLLWIDWHLHWRSRFNIHHAEGLISGRGSLWWHCSCVPFYVY